MPSDRTRDALQGIRLNIRAIRRFIEGMTVEEFSVDLRTVYAVTRALEIISEASRRLPDDLKARYPQVRWGAVRDAGNVYRHAYDRVSVTLVWSTALTQLDELWSAACRELGGEGADEEAGEQNDL